MLLVPDSAGPDVGESLHDSHSLFSHSKIWVDRLGLDCHFVRGIGKEEVEFWQRLDHGKHLEAMHLTVGGIAMNTDDLWLRHLELEGFSI